MFLELYEDPQILRQGTVQALKEAWVSGRDNIWTGVERANVCKALP